MSLTTDDYLLAFLVAITMFVIESGLIYLYPVVYFPYQNVWFWRIVLAGVIVSGSFLLARYIESSSFNIGVDLDIFMTSFIVVALEFFIYPSYSLQGFKTGSVLDPFNKVLGKFIFTAISVMIAKGIYKIRVVY
uniref:Uncharacterized protein n=1 Tax=viral metagenome TaxID=1070528 RepID=A0A6C0H6Z0_9ZZZZ